MMQGFLSYWVRIFAPLYSRALQAVAYGPWGPIHPLSIRIFSWIYKIPSSQNWDPIHQKPYPSLGSFFLRSQVIEMDTADLLSPAEGRLIEGPASLLTSSSVRVKGLDYAWQAFPELKELDFSEACFWNIYLSPPNYHWVHLPCDADSIEIRYEPGSLYPVNQWGRWLCSKLYAENERMSFRWTHPVYGKVTMLCIAAMGVSSFECPIASSPLSPSLWHPVSSPFAKGSKLLGFRLGSSVLLVIEKGQSLLSQSPWPGGSERPLRVAENLARKIP